MEVRENRRNPYKRKALGPQDLATAKSLALEFAADVRAKVRTKESIFTVPFAKAAKAFINDMKTRVASGEMSPNKLKRSRTSVERYLTPYFKDKSINAIDEDALKRFLNWRKDYYITGPGRKETHIEFVRDGEAAATAADRLAHPFWVYNGQGSGLSLFTSRLRKDQTLDWYKTRHTQGRNRIQSSS